MKLQKKVSHIPLIRALVLTPLSGSTYVDTGASTELQGFPGNTVQKKEETTGLVHGIARSCSSKIKENQKISKEAKEEQQRTEREFF